MVEHRTGIAEVMGSNPVEALIFFRLPSNCLNFKIYCDDHTSLSIESIVLETIAYCLSRLLIGYGSYERGIVVTISRKIESCFSEIQFH